MAVSGIDAGKGGYEGSYAEKPFATIGRLAAPCLEALTLDRLPLTIAIDGADGSGKSSLASWLAEEFIPTQ